MPRRVKFPGVEELNHTHTAASVPLVHRLSLSLSLSLSLCSAVMEGGRGKEIVSGFKEFVKEPLLDIININLNHSATEFWLIQSPLHHAHDLDNGKELSLMLHRDGVLCNFKGSSGKSYDVVSLTAPNPNTTVFLSSAAAEPKIVGKISRHVSLVHYPEPGELQKQNASSEKQKQVSGTLLTNSSRHLANPTQSSEQRSSKSTSTHGSKHKSSLSESREPPNPNKRKPLEEKTRSTGQSALDSGRGHSAVTSSGSLQHSNERKSKKNKQA